MSRVRNLAFSTGLATAFFYALQHPLSKPAAERLGDSKLGILLIVFAQETLLIAVVVVLLIRMPKARERLQELRKDRVSFLRLMLLAFFSTAIFALYVFLLSSRSPAYMATVQNLYPIWHILAFCILSNKDFSIDYPGKGRIEIFAPSLFLVLFAGVLLVLADYIFSGDAAPIKVVFIDIALVSCIPILYAIKVVVRDNYFGDYDAFEFVIATAVLDSVIILVITLALLGWKYDYSDFELLLNLDILAVSVGAVFATIVAGALHMKYATGSAENVLKGSIGLFLTPAIAAFLGLLGYYLTGIKSLTFERHHLAQIVVVIGVLIANAIYIENIQRQNKSDEK